MVKQNSKKTGKFLRVGNTYITFLNSYINAEKKLLEALLLYSQNIDIDISIFALTISDDIQNEVQYLNEVRNITWCNLTASYWSLTKLSYKEESKFFYPIKLFIKKFTFFRNGVQFLMKEIQIFDLF